MKIRDVKLNRFKRFSDLTVGVIPETAKLVVLAGPNGCGKSSFLEALNTWHRHAWAGRGGWEESYHLKQTGGGALSWNQTITVNFHGAQPSDESARKKAIYVRTAYRNDPEFQVQRLSSQGSVLDEDRVRWLIQNDASVGKNYERLAAQGLEDLYESKAGSTTFEEYREEAIGLVRDAVMRLFPTLVLKGVGNPLRDGTFRFDKGASKAFPYKNLSGGEKAAFDLILDLAVKRREYDDTVFCIDEPDAHMNTRLQGALLKELVGLIPDGSQLWLATHSIGMMRQARDFYLAHPDETVFIDFDSVDFDEPQALRPVVPNRAFWQSVLNVAVDDLASLIAPERVIICEGARGVSTSGKNTEHDARCYDIIFADEVPDTKFLSGGNSHDVENDRLALLQAIEALVRGSKVQRLIDRDDRSVEEIKKAKDDGIRVLSRRNLESYLFDDEVLSALCTAEGKAELVDALLQKKASAVAAARGRGAAADDLKRASGEIYNAARELLGLVGRGSDTKAFMRSTSAPLLRPGMRAYEELKKDVFG